MNVQLHMNPEVRGNMRVMGRGRWQELPKGKLGDMDNCQMGKSTKSAVAYLKLSMLFQPGSLPALSQ